MPDEPPTNKREKPSAGPLLPPRVTTAIVCLFAGLLAVVVVVGLVRNQIDPNGLALALVPTIAGILVGGAIKRGGRDDDK